MHGEEATMLWSQELLPKS